MVVCCNHRCLTVVIENLPLQVAELHDQTFITLAKLTKEGYPVIPTIQAHDSQKKALGKENSTNVYFQPLYDNEMNIMEVVTLQPQSVISEIFEFLVKC